jgi:hypothetical protein
MLKWKTRNTSQVLCYKYAKYNNVTLYRTLRSVRSHLYQHFVFLKIMKNWTELKMFPVSITRNQRISSILFDKIEH